MNLWSSLRKKREEKRDDLISIDQWAQYFNYNNSSYQFGSFGKNGRAEEIGNDFEGYVAGAYMASAVVFACCMARMIVFSEMRFTYQDMSGDRPGDLIDGPGLDLLDTPWPNGTSGELLARAIQDVDMAGNAYVVREDSLGEKPRLRRLRPDWVEIVLTADPKEARKSDVLGYLYRPGKTEDKDKWEWFPIDGSNGAVAHWAPIPDPIAQYRGMSWLTPIIREILADKAIAKHKLKFFENAATPNLAVSLDASVSKEDFAEFVEVMNSSKHGVDHAYETVYLGGGAEVSVVGANIQQMDFRTVSSIGETRIASAARVPPSVAGLFEGLGGSALNEGNFNAAKDLFASGCLRPLWRSVCAAFAPLVEVPDGRRLWYDDRDITFLREDQLKLAQIQQLQITSLTRLVMNGWKPDAAVTAVVGMDLRELIDLHTGLFSVQLLPPEISKPELAKAKAETAKNGTSKANNTPTGSKRKPVGRPPKESKDANQKWLEAMQYGDDWREDWEEDL